jgi:hypothetical protein
MENLNPTLPSSDANSCLIFCSYMEPKSSLPSLQQAVTVLSQMNIL